MDAHEIMANLDIPSALSTAIDQLNTQTRMACADALATKYGFDPTEAKRFLASSEGSPSKSKGKTKGKAKVVEASADGVVPKKRPQTGYLLFASEMRPTVKSEMIAELDEGSKVKPQEVVKELAVRWKALTAEEQGEWKDRAKTPPASSSTDSE